MLADICIEEEEEDGVEIGGNFVGKVDTWENVEGMRDSVKSNTNVVNGGVRDSALILMNP